MIRIAESSACGDWFCEWELEPGEFLYTAREGGITEDVWAERARLTVTWQHEVMFSVRLPEYRYVPVCFIPYGAIIIFGVEEL